MNTLIANMGLHKKTAILILVASIFFCNYVNADTGRYRVMFGNNSSTEMTVAFDAYEMGTNPVLYYSTNPIDVNKLGNYQSKLPDTVNEYRGMINCFVRLTDLSPGKTYYFLVKDNSGIGEMYNFETITDNNNTRLSIIGGGDSRSNWDVREKANKIIAKLNAHAVMFDGDFVNLGTSSSQWQRWLDDWQLTFNSKNRITPIIPARGNHENHNEILVNLFDCPENNVYSNTFANNLLQVYTLNSEIPANGASEQTNWLKTQLENSNSIWKFAQYHRPMRPHTKTKVEGSIQYGFWSSLFYQYGVDAVLEGDSHTSKTTWPIIPCSGGFDCDEGFKRDDDNGTVYLGEGAFASPLREANDNKLWTRDSGKFYQFKWIFVDKNEMQVRTVMYDADANIDSITELSDVDRFTIPDNLEIWKPSNGDVVTLNKQTANPSCTLTVPANNAWLFNLDEIQLCANATGTSAITEVQFYVNGNLIDTDNTAPYETNWKPSLNGLYLISAIAQDENGLSSNFDFSTINIGGRNNLVHTSSIDIGTDECIEYAYKRIGLTGLEVGHVSVDDVRIRFGELDISLQGLRFKEINIPPNAIIDSAYIKFNPIGGFETAQATIWCEDNSNSLTFIPVPFNLSEREKTLHAVEWNNMPAWNSATTAAGATSPDLSILIQHLVERPDWTIESPITFLINGSGKRNATSFMGTQLTAVDSSTAPTLVVQFSIPEVMGCTDIKACNYNPEATNDDGSCLLPIVTCDDGNSQTINDKLDEDCNCVGEIMCDVVNLTMETTNTYTIITWDAVPDATYEFLYKKSGQSSFRSFPTNIPFIILFGLDGCTAYEFVVKVICQNGEITKLSDPLYYGSPNCKGLNENIYISNQSVLKVYPQPATDYMTIELLGDSKADVINIYNTEGKTVIKQNDLSFDGKAYRANVKHLSAGIYIVTIIKDNYKETKKVLVN